MMATEHSLKVAGEWLDAKYPDWGLPGAVCVRDLAALLDRELQAQHERTAKKCANRVLLNWGIGTNAECQQLDDRRACERVAAAPRPTGEPE